MANNAFASIRDFEDLLDYLRDREAGSAVLSSTRFCEILGIDTELLADLAKVPGSAAGPVSAWEGAQCFIRGTLRVLHAASDLNGDIERTVFWFRNEPLVPFGQETAERLVAKGRVDDVIRYVMSLDAGVVG